MSIKIVGLGPGPANLLTREAWDLISSRSQIYVRTGQHPVMAQLPAHIEVLSFDHLYEQSDDFDKLYQEIADQVVMAAKESEREGEDLIFGVPGDPMVGEAAVTRLIDQAARYQLRVEIITGLSFIEPTLKALNIDALNGLQIFDCLELLPCGHPPINPDVPLLLAQTYNRLVVSELKLVLMTIYPDDHPVSFVHRAGNNDEEIEMLPLYEIDRSTKISHLSALFVPEMPVRSSLMSLADTVAYLRGPYGCPWDQEQTSQSLRLGFHEEAAEVLTAIDLGFSEQLKEELGDLLYHIVMQAQIAQENEEFTLAEVVAGIESKLRYRHPHVWGDWQADNSEQVLENWELLKRREYELNNERRHLLDGLPAALSSLAMSQKIQQKVASIGFDWNNVVGVFEKIREELAELEQARTADDISQELGDLLFIVVNLARWFNLDAESVLRESNLRFIRRFTHVETMAEASGLDIRQMSLDELNVYWEKAKLELNS